MRRASLALITMACLGCARSAKGSHAAGEGDSSFAAMQERGKDAMGVDQYTSSHIFEPAPNGGRIVLQRDSVDEAGTGAIRAHLVTIVIAFSQGQFDIPGFVHAQTVPGTAVMTARSAAITYSMDTLPRGGEVIIQSNDSVAVNAIHEFLAFQANAHHAADHDHSSMPAP